MLASWEVSREKRRRTGKYAAAAVFILVMVDVVVDVFVVNVIFVVAAARICIIGASRDQHVKNISINHSWVDVRNHVIEP